jgi:hypothetical protein
MSVILSGEFVARDYHLFPVLKANLGGYKLKDDCEVETVVTR